MALRIMRMILGLVAISWGIAALGIALPWDTLDTLFHNFGARTLTHDPMLEYWIRMASGAYAAIGAFFAMLAIRPERYAALIPFAGTFLLLEGLVLLYHGVLLRLAPWPFYADTTACLGGGLALLALHHATRTAARTDS